MGFDAPIKQAPEEQAGRLVQVSDFLGAKIYIEGPVAFVTAYSGGPWHGASLDKGLLPAFLPDGRCRVRVTVETWPDGDDSRSPGDRGVE